MTLICQFYGQKYTMLPPICYLCAVKFFKLILWRKTYINILTIIY
jgi:hypothetical protein